MVLGNKIILILGETGVAVAIDLKANTGVVISAQLSALVWLQAKASIQVYLQSLVSLKAFLQVTGGKKKIFTLNFFT